MNENKKQNESAKNEMAIEKKSDFLEKIKNENPEKENSENPKKNNSSLKMRKSRKEKIEISENPAEKQMNAVFSGAEISPEKKSKPAKKKTALKIEASVSTDETAAENAILAAFGNDENSKKEKIETTKTEKEKNEISEKLTEKKISETAAEKKMNELLTADAPEKPTEKKSFFQKISAFFYKKDAEKPTEKSTEKNDAGNAFTDVFEADKNPKSDDDDLVESIIQTAKAEQTARSKVLGTRFTDQVERRKRKADAFRFNTEKSREAHKSLAVARFVAAFSLLVPVASFLTFGMLLNPDNSFSDLIRAHNYGRELRDLEIQKTEKETRLTKLGREINKKKTEIEEMRNNKILANILKTRIDFLQVFARISKIMLSSIHLTPEVNDALDILYVSSFSGFTDGEKTEISISGKVRDPKRMSLTKLTQLMETINADPDFEGAIIRSFSKSDDSEGGAQSNFSFHLQYIPPTTLDSSSQ